MTNMYIKEICPRNNDFSHVTLDTLALQYTGVTQIIGNCLSFAPGPHLRSQVIDIRMGKRYPRTKIH